MSASETKRTSPYKGLIPYDEADAPFFFGRDRETRLIIANLFASPMTLLYGPSGVGKSSVLRAAVACQLRERDDPLVVVFNAWQNNPLNGLTQAIADAASLADHISYRKVVQHLPQDRRASLAELLGSCSTQLNRRLMIVLDQFEEYFLYHPKDDEFAAEFPRAVTHFDAPVSFLISIREDFYAKLDRFEGRIPTLYDNYLRIEHLDRNAARVAIEKPIAEYNRLYATDEQYSIEPRLVEAVLSQVETGRVVIGEAGRGVIDTAKSAEDSEAQIETPFLQLVMTRLWEKELQESSYKLRLQTLDELGGAANIVRTHLDAVISKLTSDEQKIAASVFHYLVTPSGTKIAYTASDLAASAGLSHPKVVDVLRKLSHHDVRILRPVDPSPGQPGAPRYEIFHDVLAPAVLAWVASTKVSALTGALESTLERFATTGHLDPALMESLSSISDPDVINRVTAKLEELGAYEGGSPPLEISDYYRPRNAKHELKWPLSLSLSFPFNQLDEETQFYVLFGEFTRREMEGNYALHSGDAATARLIFEECLARADQLNVAELRARSLEGLIRVAQREGDKTAERKLSQAALAVRAQDETRVTKVEQTFAKRALAMLDLEQGDFEHSESLLSELINELRDSDRHYDLCIALLDRASVRSAQQRWNEALADLNYCVDLTKLLKVTNAYRHLLNAFSTQQLICRQLLRIRA